jgi:hypothetical protein
MGRVAVRGVAGVALGMACLACLACARAGKHEASSLMDAVDRFRRAENADKPARALVVAAVECSAADVCDAKRVCLGAIDPTARALTLKSEVELRLADIQRGALDPHSPEASALPGKLDEAQKLLEDGRTKMPECERRLTDLMIEYGG